MADGSTQQRGDDDDRQTVEERLLELEIKHILLEAVTFASLKASPLRETILGAMEIVWERIRELGRPDITAAGVKTMESLREALATETEGSPSTS